SGHRSDLPARDARPHVVAAHVPHPRPAQRLLPRPPGPHTRAEGADEVTTYMTHIARRASPLDALYYRQHDCPMPTPVRTLRVPDDLWTAAKDTAARRGELIGDVLIGALER